MTEAAAQLGIGQQVGGRYAIRALLGAGAMGAVYEVVGPDGAHYAMKAPQHWIRTIVIVVGFSMSAYFFYRAYR